MDQQQLDLPGMMGNTDNSEVKAGDGIDAEVMKRGELHVHINGAIPAATIREIFADEATPLPAGFQFERDVVRTTPCQSLAEYLGTNGPVSCTMN